MKTRFEIEPENADALRAAGLADFDALFNAPAGPPTSKHRHRETVPIEFDVNGRRQRFFLKRVFKVPGQHSWRPWLRGKPGYSQPAREWDNIKMMRDAGLPVMKRVAIGERCKFGIPVQAFILVEDVGMRWTLENWLLPGFPKPPNVDQIDTRQLWYELGKLRRNFEIAAISWPDAHAKHIFAAPIEGSSVHSDRWKLALIDVERAIHKPASLAEPLGRRSQYLDYTEPFWKSLNHFPDYLARSYHAAGRDGRIVEEPICDEKQTRCWLGSEIRRLSLPDSYEHPGAEGITWQGGIKASERGRALLARIGIYDIDSAFALSDVESLSKPGLQSHRDRLRIAVKSDDGRDIILYIKRYRCPPFREQVRRIFEADRTHSTGYREYQAARLLLEREIPAMMPVAVGEELRGWWERRSFVVTIAVEGESLESLARKWQLWPESGPTVKEKWELIARVAFLTVTLRAWGFYHRDLYLSHVFLSRNSRGEVVLQLIDLARMLQSPRWNKRWEIKDLAALSYSVPPGILTRTDRLRFMRARKEGYFLCDESWRRTDPYALSMRSKLLNTIRKINRRVAKMARHDAKRTTRLGISQKTSNRPLAGSTNSQSVQTPTE